MASKKKKKKGINSYLWHFGLKSKGRGIKRVDFYTSSDRQKIKRQTRESIKEQMMSKKKPCGLDYCPLEEIVGIYASCIACAWGNDDDDESEEVDNETD